MIAVIAKIAEIDWCISMTAILAILAMLYRNLLFTSSQLTTFHHAVM